MSVSNSKQDRHRLRLGACLPNHSRAFFFLSGLQGAVHSGVHCYLFQLTATCWQSIRNVTFAAFESHVTYSRDLLMKQTNNMFTRKRKIWSARLEVFARHVERWLEEHYKLAFFWFMMVLLFATQLLLWLV